MSILMMRLIGFGSRTVIFQGKTLKGFLIDCLPKSIKNEQKMIFLTF